MPDLVHVIFYAIAFLLTLAAIRKSLMVTGWQWNRDLPKEIRRTTYAIFLGFTVAIIAAVVVGIAIGYPVTGCFVAIGFGVTYLIVANFFYRCYYGAASG